MKMHIIFLLLPFSIVGCFTKPVYTGKYASKSGSYGLQINEDSTFNYKFYQFHAYEYSTGKWHKEGNRKIILNSLHKNITMPLTVIESGSNSDSINRFSFEFRSIEIGAKDCECAIFINDTLKEIRRCDSMALIAIKEPVQKVFVQVRKSPLLMTSLRFSLDPLITNVYSTPKEYGNLTKFKIIINDSLFSYKVFDNKIIKVKEKGIYFYDDKGEKKHWIPKLND